MAGVGVETLYIETSNSRQAKDVVHASAIGRLVEAAHASGMDVVAWYLPYLTKPARDLRRSLAAVRFRSQHGQRFDSFALDIESSAVANVSVRTTRLLAVSRSLRRAVGRNYALGGIIPSPRGMQLLPRYWPGFPYRALAGTYDVFLPMSYFSYRAKGAQATHDYTARNVGIIRAATGRPGVAIHMIGGVASGSSTGEVRAFVRAARECDVEGASLYDYVTTGGGQWRELTALNAGPLPATALCGTTLSQRPR
jgi:hypothetical protein